MSELDLPPFSLDVETMNLGPNVKAIGMELIETESREPVRGPDATAIWTRILPALIAQEPFVLDFFSHLDRVREYCDQHQVKYREAGKRSIVIGQRRGIAMLEDNRLAKTTRARKGKKRFREIDTDDTTLRPARSHRTGKAAGPTAHIEQRAIISKCCKIEEPIRQPARTAAEEHLVGGAIGRLVDIRV